MTHHDVIVVGAGVVGCATALELAPDHDVLVLERDGIASGASGRAGGVITPSLYLGEVPGAAALSTRFFREFDGTGSFEFRERPRIEFVRPSDERDARERAERLAADGLPVAFLDAATAAERYPPFDHSGFAGVIEVADAGWIDPETYTRTLAAQARSGGVEFRTDTRVAGVEFEGDAAAGVRTGEGVVRAGRVVAAAGWRTGALLGDVATIPVRPYHSQCVVLDPPTDVDVPIGRSTDAGIYFRPAADGNLLVGGGSGPVDDPETRGDRAEEAFLEQARRSMARLLPAVEGSTVADDWAGVAGIAPDGTPILGEIRPGLVAVQASVMGVLASPALAAGVRALVTGEEAPFDLGAFSLDRFDTPSLDFEAHSMSSGRYH